MANTTARSSVHAAMSLSDCIRLARRLGATVEHIRRTGEVRIIHPRIGSTGAINSRRKDSPRHATAWLRRLERFELSDPR